jgi:hypothetical protein
MCFTRYIYCYTCSKCKKIERNFSFQETRQKLRTVVITSTPRAKYCESEYSQCRYSRITIISNELYVVVCTGIK